MTDPNETLPPRVPNTPRNLLAKLMAWCQAHPVATAAALGFAAGWLLPKVLAWVL